MLAALAHGKHAASECPIGTTLKDLWALVDASERAQKHCMQLENCNYGYNEMMVNRMVHDGTVRRGAARRGGVPARPAEDPLRDEGRGTLAPRLAHALQLQPLSRPTGSAP